jgi:hypothetical protein
MPSGPSSTPTPSKSSPPNFSTEALQALRAQQSAARGHSVIPSNRTDADADAAHDSTSVTKRGRRRRAVRRSPVCATPAECKVATPERSVDDAAAHQQQTTSKLARTKEQHRSCTRGPTSSANSLQLHDSPAAAIADDVAVSALAPPEPRPSTPPPARSKPVSSLLNADNPSSAAFRQPRTPRGKRAAESTSQQKTPVQTPAPPSSAGLPTPVPGPRPSKSFTSTGSRRSERQRDTREWIERKTADLDELQSALLNISIAPRLPRESGSAPAQGAFEWPVSHSGSSDRGRSRSVAPSSKVASRGATVSPQLRLASDVGEAPAFSSRSRSNKPAAFRTRSAIPPARVGASKKRSPYLASVLPAPAPKAVPTPLKGAQGSTKPPVIGALKELEIKPRVAIMACQRKQI